MTKTSTPLRGEEGQAGAVETAPLRLEGSEVALAVPSPSAAPVGASESSPWAPPPGVKEAQRELEAEQRKARAAVKRVLSNPHRVAQDHAVLLGALVMEHGEVLGQQLYASKCKENLDQARDIIALEMIIERWPQNDQIKFALDHLDNMAKPKIVKAALKRIGAAKPCAALIKEIVQVAQKAKRDTAPERAEYLAYIKASN